MIKINDFFDIDSNNIPKTEPINRVAFSKEDVKYKAKCIKAMQDLGMEITIDKIGNICGTFPGKLFQNKSIICGSHTDSVDNAGQFDGPLGVYVALKTAEKIAHSNNQNLVNYKAVIYASEESTRFSGKACLGSKYLRGDNLDFSAIKSRENRTLEDILIEFKEDLQTELEKIGANPIKEVDKIIKEDEIITALEGHIEQANQLTNNKNTIGLCTSIVAPYRLKADIKDIESAARFICNLTEHAKLPNSQSLYRATIPEFSIKNPVSTSDLENVHILNLHIIGENNHSGATPMNQRKDAVYGTAKFIELLSKDENIHFTEVNTPSWGANQINNSCYLQLAIDKNSADIAHKSLEKAKKVAELSSNVTFKKVANLPKRDENNGLFVDVRQQVGMNSKISNEMIYQTIKDITHTTNSNAYINVASKGEPFKTSMDLVNSAQEICNSENINYEVMQSWAGHDLATLTSNPNARTLLIFCDNIGGSHNPLETTSISSINDLVNVESSLAIKELDRANQLYLSATYNSLLDKKINLDKHESSYTEKVQFINSQLEKINTLSAKLGIEIINNQETERGLEI